MTVPNIETFEYNISEEVKKKSASVSNIVSASGTIGNLEEPKKKIHGSGIIILIGISLMISAILSIFAINFFLNKKTSTTNNIDTKKEIANIGGNQISLYKVMPIFDQTVGRFISNVKKTDNGYVFELKQYSNVFAYVFKNENEFIKEAFDLLYPEITGEGEIFFDFTDTTEANLNMRVAENNQDRIVYTFINNRFLLIAKDTKSILLMRSAIIK